MGNEVGQIKPFPDLKVAFETLARTAIQRSARGIACLILKDSKKTTKWVTLKTIADLKDKEWDAKNVKYIKLAMHYGANKVLVRVLQTGENLDDALGELPEELQYESLSDLHDQIVEHMQGLLIQYRENNRPIDLSLVLKEQLEAYPLSRHFDVARIIVDQAVRLGMANDDLAGLYPQWQEINDYGAEVQAHVIDKY